MDEYTRTRVSLHGVAEGILAGPQYEHSGTIRLRALQGGFGTVAAPMLRVAGADVVSADGQRVPLRGSFREVAQAVGVTFTVPGIYSEHAGVSPDEHMLVDPRSAAQLSAWLQRGRQGLDAFWPGQVPVLWPEHFDLAISVDDVNYGVSPGDGFCAEPYAYVGPWGFDAGAVPHATSPFWNAPFGALLRIHAAPDSDALARFFRTGRAQVAKRPRSDKGL